MTRHNGGDSNMHYFDLLIRLKTEQEHLFRNIHRTDYHTLFEYFKDKSLKMMNLGSKEETTGGASVLDAIDDPVDPHLAGTYGRLCCIMMIYICPMKDGFCAQR
ncbi:hypothetical protein ACS0TY_021745 [Phlomoides rotata]